MYMRYDTIVNWPSSLDFLAFQNQFFRHMIYISEEERKKNYKSSNRTAAVEK